MISTKQILQMKYFFLHYCPGIANWKKKLSGKSGKGQPITFTEEDITRINTGLKKLSADIKKGYIE